MLGPSGRRRWCWRRHLGHLREEIICRWAVCDHNVHAPVTAVFVRIHHNGLATAGGQAQCPALQQSRRTDVAAIPAPRATWQQDEICAIIYVAIRRVSYPGGGLRGCGRGSSLLKQRVALVGICCTSRIGDTAATITTFATRCAWRTISNELTRCLTAAFILARRHIGLSSYSNRCVNAAGII